MKRKFLIAGLLVCVLVCAVAFANRDDSFAPAEDLPRDALVYAQLSDLPAFIKLWNESRFKEKYLASQNFNDFSKNHLALKLASRWQEFNDAVGFPIDSDALNSLTKTRAAVGVYDIGKLEFVFLTPVNDEVFAATKFMQSSGNFEEQTLDDGTIVYRVAVEADRGRQNQELLFTNVKGRFVLATSEKLLVRTLANINGKSGKDRLSSEPSFKNLHEKIEPHLATVWVNQAALNDDYYFKHYWLMPNLDELKNIRAGIFDFALEEGKLIERRKFLLDKTTNSPSIATTKSLANLPADTPFYRLQAAKPQAIADAIAATIFDRESNETKTVRRRRSHYYSNYDYFEPDDYTYLGERFDETINEIEDKAVETRRNEADFSNLLESANPQAVLTFAQPKVLPAPLFVEFRRAAVFSLGSASRFNREAFEAAIEQSVAARVLISAPGTKLNWETHVVNDITRRELNLPMLGWSVGYALRGDELILSNNVDFLSEILSNGGAKTVEKTDSAFSELTVLLLDGREAAYDRVFAELAGKNVASEFFTGNIASLLDAISEVKKIEVKRSGSGNFLVEEIVMSF